MNEKFQQALRARYSQPLQQALWYMRHGVERRRRILRLLREQGERLAVNRSHCLNLRYDDDLAKLLRSGELVRVRPLGVGRCRHTYLVPAAAAGDSTSRGARHG